MKNKRVFVLLVLMAFVCGCKRAPEKFVFEGVTRDENKCQIQFTANVPLNPLPVVAYRIEKNPERVNDVVLTILQNPSQAKDDDQICDVKKIDDRRLMVTIPLQKTDYPARFFIDKKLISEVGKLEMAAESGGNFSP